MNTVCAKCNRDISKHKTRLCPYCGHDREVHTDPTEDTLPPPESNPTEGQFTGCPTNVQIPLMGEGPGRVMVEYANKKERREVIVRIGEERILDMIGLGKRAPHGYFYVPIFDSLPEGYTVRGVWSDPLSRCFMFAVEHPSFEPVPEGMPSPEYPKPLTVTMMAVRVADYNPNEVRFDASKLSPPERSKLENAIDKCINYNEMMVLVPPDSKPISTVEGRRAVIDFCQGIIDKIGTPHPWSQGTVENPLIKKHLANAFNQLQTVKGFFATCEWKLTVSDTDAEAMQSSEEMATYFEAARDGEDGISRAKDNPSLVVTGYRLPKLLYGVQLVVDPHRRPRRPLISRGPYENIIYLGD